MAVDTGALSFNASASNTPVGWAACMPTGGSPRLDSPMVCRWASAFLTAVLLPEEEEEADLLMSLLAAALAAAAPTLTLPLTCLISSITATVFLLDF